MAVPYRDAIYHDAVKLHKGELLLPLPPAGPSPEPRFVARSVAGREVFVADGFADQATCARLHRFALRLPYRRQETDRPDTAHQRSFSVTLDPGFLADEPLFARFDAVVAHLFPEERHALYRAYVNCFVYGDMTYPHRDCPADRTDVTVLYYINSEWSRDWAGETLFYEEDGEPVLAVLPRPGRIAVFRGAIEHRSGVPSRDCREERLTLAYKLRPVAG